MSRSTWFAAWTSLMILIVSGWAGSAAGQEKLQDQPLGETPRQETKWPPKNVTQIDINPSPGSDKIPPDSADTLILAAAPVHWFNSAYAYQCKAWYPPRIVYNPLYFEDPILERDGDAIFRSPLLESSRGAARLGLQLIVWPFNLVAAPPHACEAPPAVNQCRDTEISRPAILYGHR